MTEGQRHQKHDNEQYRNTTAGTNADQDTPARQQTDGIEDTTMPRTNDASDGISEASLYDASGAATGGGVDTPTAVEHSTEDEVRQQTPINQGSSAYTGGGADNGSDL